MLQARAIRRDARRGGREHKNRKRSQESHKKQGQPIDIQSSCENTARRGEKRQDFCTPCSLFAARWTRADGMVAVGWLDFQERASQLTPTRAHPRRYTAKTRANQERAAREQQKGNQKRNIRTKQRTTARPWSAWVGGHWVAKPHAAHGLKPLD